MIANYTNWSVVIPLVEGSLPSLNTSNAPRSRFFHGQRIREGTIFFSILSNSTSAGKTFFSQVSVKSCRAKKVVKAQDVV